MAMVRDGCLEGPAARTEGLIPHASHGQPDPLPVVTPAHDAAIADRNGPGAGTIHRRSGPPAGDIADMAEDAIKIAISPRKGREAGCVVSVPFIMGFHSDGCSILSPQIPGKRRPLLKRWDMPPVRGQPPRIDQHVLVIKLMVFVSGSRIPIIITPRGLMLVSGSLPFGGAF